MVKRNMKEIKTSGFLDKIKEKAHDVKDKTQRAINKHNVDNEPPKGGEYCDGGAMGRFRIDSVTKSYEAPLNYMESIYVVLDEGTGAEYNIRRKKENDSVCRWEVIK